MASGFNDGWTRDSGRPWISRSKGKRHIASEGVAVVVAVVVVVLAVAASSVVAVFVVKEFYLTIPVSML